jgi:ABC-type branched-subunit amino acid transport system substrate-binding protein
MKRLGMINAYLLGGDAMCNIELARLGRDAVDEHVYCPQGGPVLENTGSGRQFKTDYRNRYNTDPLTYSASIYDGLKLVAQAMKAANSIEPAQYRTALAGIDMQGVAGRYRFDPNRDLRDSPITIYTYRNGTLVPLPQDK